LTAALVTCTLLLVGGLLVDTATADDKGLPAVETDIKQLHDLICDATYVILGADAQALIALPQHMCDVTCPCFDVEALQNSTETGCIDTNNNEERISLPDQVFSVSDRGLNTAEGAKRFTECRVVVNSFAEREEITRRQAAHCIRIMEAVLGPCS
jgi:hypothetical protein